MPFINDMLGETQRRRKNEAALAAANIANPLPAPAASTKPGVRSRFGFDVAATVEALRAEILGQDHAIEELEHMLKIVRADIADPRRPLFVGLFMGPTGVGKTETVRALARAIHGDADAFCRIDMNTLSQEHYSAALTGAPPGYVGAKEGKTILDQEKIEGSHGKPGIVLFDEIEKASDEVVQALLNVFDNGLLTVASGERTYSFRNALVFMTSNLGAREIQDYERRQQKPLARLLGVLSPEARKRKVREIAQNRLLKAFPPEFVNRIDNVTVFNCIEGALARDLLRLEVERLNRRLRKHHCRVELRESALNFLVEQGFDRQFGARALRRAIRRHVEAPFAQMLLTEYTTPDIVGQPLLFTGDLADGEIVFRPA